MNTGKRYSVATRRGLTLALSGVMLAACMMDVGEAGDESDIGVTSAALTVTGCLNAGYSATSIIEGTSGANTLNGTSGDDCILGYGGNDVIYGGAGNDLIAGGSGNDTIYGEGGRDAIQGDGDNDIIYGGADGDAIQGWSGDDTLNGDDGSDRIVGGPGTNTNIGGANTDYCYQPSTDGSCEVAGTSGGVGRIFCSAADTYCGIAGDTCITAIGVCWEAP